MNQTRAIRRAETDDEVRRCFPVMLQLRPHLEEERFVATIRRQEAGGFRLAYLEADGDVVAVAGYRFLDNLAGTRILYVDDLVTDANRRSGGYGGALLDWLVERAREEGCLNLELDSGVHRLEAHRFYFVHRMHISSYHFRLAL